ncbi:unnamed protein product [Microthlaspi erraticum]|uniref:GCK domain-containing protein n=1 Tax=Microthlaspi erraticum TaxID=1685480 RepID=A0A6D2KU24_9BRAS|nr:unnamed protein product [Microthlaspi erraticum]
MEDYDVEDVDDVPEKVSVQLEAMAKATVEMVDRELNDFLPLKLEESSSTDEREEYDELSVRFCDFMEAGGCKESFKALEDCMDDTQRILKCRKHLTLLKKCMDAHFCYYQPILKIAKTAEVNMLKDIHAFVLKQEEEELAASNQADEG